MRTEFSNEAQRLTFLDEDVDVVVFVVIQLFFGEPECDVAIRCAHRRGLFVITGQLALRTHTTTTTRKYHIRMQHGTMDLFVCHIFRSFPLLSLSLSLTYTHTQSPTRDVHADPHINIQIQEKCRHVRCFETRMTVYPFFVGRRRSVVDVQGDPTVHDVQSIEGQAHPGVWR